MRNTTTEAATWLAVIAAAVFPAAPVSSARGSATDTGLIEQGRYLIHAGGCISCHTADEDDAQPLAGGRVLETPFGAFHVPNITPDAETGIGNWTDAEFIDALHNGVGPGGEDYFPAFPYTSYAGMTETDVLAIKAYLFSLEPVRSPNVKHDLAWYLSTRLAARIWKSVYFRPAPFAENPARDAQWNRGAYLVRHLGHCGECHTPRARSGAVRHEFELAGQPEGPGGDTVPDITPNRENGIGRWSIQDITMFLEFGMMPGGDFAGSDMSPVIDDNTSQLTAEDRAAIAVYLKSVTPSSELTESQ